MLDAEFITLVKIKNESHIHDIAQHLTDTGVVYEYNFFEQAQPNSGHDAMQIGVLFKKGVSVADPNLLPSSDLDNIVDNNKIRWAFVCDVNIGKFDFKLIAVHLKSGRGTEEQELRDDQCKVIGHFIAELCGEQNRNPDMLLMGDFNMIPGQDISNFHRLGVDDIMNFVSLWDLQERYFHILPLQVLCTGTWDLGRQNIVKMCQIIYRL